ncbi:hypothetical protein AB0J86_19635 [Micromonospora sp. NPDC049559]|uniref:hypothetical protein n=1 Tax=Micromonospora sp. NPDC049559 TaxID=3155923 RepID=UPI00343DB85B
MRVWGRREREYVRAYLLHEALIEIRYLAFRPESAKHPDGHLEQIRVIADVCHNLPTAGGLRPDEFDPFVWMWQTANAYQREWLTRHLDKLGVDYSYLIESPQLPRPATPPATRPAFRPGGWQLPRTPGGFKALDTVTLESLARELVVLEPSSSRYVERQLAHLQPDGRHILRARRKGETVHSSDGPEDFREYHALLTMVDGAVVVGRFQLRESSFAALPADLTRLRRFQLAAVPPRRGERDVYLWGRDHEATDAACSQCERLAKPRHTS